MMTPLSETHSSDLYVSFDELCSLTNITVQYMFDLVEYEIAVPVTGTQPQEWQFTIATINLANKATRLHRDLEIDWADIKLVLNLVDVIEQLKNENRQLKQQLKRFSNRS